MAKNCPDCNEPLDMGLSYPYCKNCDNDFDFDVCTKCGSRNTKEFEDYHECYDCGEIY